MLKSHDLLHRLSPHSKNKGTALGEVSSSGGCFGKSGRTTLTEGSASSHFCLLLPLTRHLCPQLVYLQGPEMASEQGGAPGERSPWNLRAALGRSKEVLMLLAWDPTVRTGDRDLKTPSQLLGPEPVSAFENTGYNGRQQMWTEIYMWYPSIGSCQIPQLVPNFRDVQWSDTSVKWCRNGQASCSLKKKKKKIFYVNNAMPAGRGLNSDLEKMGLQAIIQKDLNQRRGQNKVPISCPKTLSPKSPAWHAASRTCLDTPESKSGRIINVGMNLRTR
ncbi:uncharacterized protein LOC116657289 isoform X2 [Camelus ferus]|uniref:Uncharacterized protein LOC116657289 isoform X2 n=1 Tax=Camelus ferus TaxID=419612 RepID=A0A8B8RDZ7_CAMFR|nr:uncharacterized protein LOC116657289 isoform X2 [Camelus ferus]